VILLLKLVKKTKLIIGLTFLTLLATSILISTRGYYYQTDLEIGETLVYKRHDFNYTTQAWDPWRYLMYEIYSIEDTIGNIEEETIIKAAQWVSNDTIHWKQVQFSSNQQNNEESKIGIIARLQEVPIQRFSSLQKENFAIRSDIKLGDLIREITQKINSSLDEEDWLGLEPIRDGFGLRIEVKECGCSIEGGTSKRIRNITYSTRGILENYHFSESVEYGPDAEANKELFEIFLVPEFNASGVTFENISSNRNGFVSPIALGSGVILSVGIPTLLAMLLVAIRKRN
jgi:hypothetical protein